MEKQEIFGIKNNRDFEEACLQVFQQQYRENRVYRKFCDLLTRTPEEVSSVASIPFMPIEFFKQHRILCEGREVVQTFTSSGTTGSQTSKHHVPDLSIYEHSFRRGFEQFYGPVKDFVVLALLPSYLERTGSSLIYMVDDMIRESDHPESGFFLKEIDELAVLLKRLDQEKKKVLLIGVSFALLDLVERHRFQLKHTVVMETGGMKGRRKELIRAELHSILKEGFGVGQIHSEYGMTELLSQAYSRGDGIFNTPPWMRVLIRDMEDPFSYLEDNRTGGINVIDLANIHTCSFIATQDLGRRHAGGFEVLGRFDNSDIRGCNLMVM
ncbi:acyl transferase [Robertkochia marina]|uniref:Acyl transferase n=1 Tax=Robertkochia marina TaxID=1227945 RepID=A0A4S3M3J7_9FLAO|nr:acyl transferase [Robertkochia marina]THD69752.1 acyl transferase [Robertkochia marina]TRZ46905.1 acyl transferase [Robertkochia marina]